MAYVCLRETPSGVVDVRQTKTHDGMPWDTGDQNIVSITYFSKVLSNPY